MTKFSKILIANRGEIAVRIAQTARKLGYRTVAVFSDADADALHVNVADQAVRIGSAPSVSSYLNIESILEAARKTGADAIHPGYGFLAENEKFAQACKDHGVTFIGPEPETIKIMGNKQEAKERVQNAGVTCIPGYHGKDQSESRLIAESAKVGFPLMVKAVAGGGGKGTRLVNEESDLLEALRSARSEALNAFGNDVLMLEKAIVDARHVEIQIFADSQGNTIFLGERDCSIQRRHQKVVEESPSPAVDEALRGRMGKVAVDVAKSVNYLGAGTVEFLLEDSGEFYFLEMNTRLQVEHPVTELVTGLDLVELQLKVAAGQPLGISQDEVKLSGHAMEVRLYAEDPAKGFLPQTGKVLAWEVPEGEGIRVDHGLKKGDTITPHYDPILAKIISFGVDREEARRKLQMAVEDTVFLGVKSNQGFLARVLRHSEFIRGDFTTDFIEQHFSQEKLSANIELKNRALGLVALLIHNERARNSSELPSTLNWQSANSTPKTYQFQSSDEILEVSVTSIRSSGYLIKTSEDETEYRLLELSNGYIRWEQNGVLQKAFYAMDKDTVYLTLHGEQICLRNITLAPPASKDVIGEGTSLAVMDGSIVAVLVEKGQSVNRGDRLVLLEAMKMEHPICAGISGIISSVQVRVGQQVKARQLLVEIVESNS